MAATHCLLPNAAMFGLACAADMLAYGGWAANVRIAGLFGFSKRRVWTYAAINFVSGTAGVTVLVAWLGAGAAPRFDIALVARVAATMLAQEVCFNFMHGTMHRHLPQLHLLHHCGHFTGPSLNLMFNPLDQMIEFSLPTAMAGLLLGTDIIPCMHDPFALVVTMTIAFTIGIASHDHLLNLHHAAHHGLVNADYCAYGDLHFWKFFGDGTARTHDRKDMMRGLVSGKVGIAGRRSARKVAAAPVNVALPR